MRPIKITGAPVEQKGTSLTAFAQERVFAACVGNGVADLAQMSPRIAEQGEAGPHRFGKGTDERGDLLWSASDNLSENGIGHRNDAAGNAVRALHGGFTFKA